MHAYKMVPGTEFQRIFACHEVEFGLWPVQTRYDKEVQVAHACSLSIASVRRTSLPTSQPSSTSFAPAATTAKGASHGDKLFHYMYFHNSRWKTELTRNNTCPLCLVKCGSTNGLRHHVEAYHDQFSFSQGANKTDITVKCRDDVYDSQGNHLMQDAEFFDYPLHREFVYVSKAKYGRCAVPLERDTAKLRATFPPKPKWGINRAHWAVIRTRPEQEPSQQHTLEPITLDAVRAKQAVHQAQRMAKRREPAHLTGGQLGTRRSGDAAAAAAAAAQVRLAGLFAWGSICVPMRFVPRAYGAPHQAHPSRRR
jgi:hypothetical protein